MAKTAAEMIRDAKARVETVSPRDALAEVGEGKAVFVDVREAEEWQQRHIEGAIAAPRGLLEFFADPTDPRHKDGLDPSGRVIVVCESGGRASLAALTLKDLGYENVGVLDGGLTAWKDAGLPTVEHEHSGM
jgi:rhodanese-related sulfurtransferase